jgi:hypothetical protein
MIPSAIVASAALETRFITVFVQVDRGAGNIEKIVGQIQFQFDVGVVSPQVFVFGAFQVFTITWFRLTTSETDTPRRARVNRS